MRESNKLQAEMMDAIRSGAAWFTTGKDKFVKIGYSKVDGCYFARECNLKDGSLEGGAYSFGTDWFDISFHGKRIDIYTDPETFKRWDVLYDPVKGTAMKGVKDAVSIEARILEFCKQADREALAGNLEPFVISGTNFDKVIQLSED